MTLRSLWGTALVSCIALSQTAEAADPGCWRTEEVRAARLQSLQHVLMVDTLKCQDTLPATVASYNAFLNRRRDMLLRNKYAVQAHFVRLLGPSEGMKAAANFDTQVGNRLSAAPVDVKRCESTGLYARLATEAAEDDLLSLATMLAGDGGPVACAADAAAPAPAPLPAAMVIPVWKKPAQAVTPAIVPAAAPAPLPTGDTAALIAAVRRQKAAAMAAPVAAAVRPVPAVLPATEALVAARVEVASLTPPPSPTAEQQRADTLKALQAAAAALARAAESIRPAGPDGLPLVE